MGWSIEGLPKAGKTIIIKKKGANQGLALPSGRRQERLCRSLGISEIDEVRNSFCSFSACGNWVSGYTGMIKKWEADKRRQHPWELHSLLLSLGRRGGRSRKAPQDINPQPGVTTKPRLLLCFPKRFSAHFPEWIPFCSCTGMASIIAWVATNKSLKRRTCSIQIGGFSPV